MFSKLKRNKKKKEVREETNGEEGPYDKYIKRLIYLYVTRDESALLEEIKNGDDMMLKAHSTVVLYSLKDGSTEEGGVSGKKLYELLCKEIGISEEDAEDIFKTLDKDSGRINDESAYVAKWFTNFTSGDPTLTRDDLMWKKYGSKY